MTAGPLEELVRTLVGVMVAAVLLTLTAAGALNAAVGVW